MGHAGGRRMAQAVPSRWRLVLLAAGGIFLAAGLPLFALAGPLGGVAEAASCDVNLSLSPVVTVAGALTTMTLTADIPGPAIGAYQVEISQWNSDFRVTGAKAGPGVSDFSAGLPPGGAAGNVIVSGVSASGLAGQVVLATLDIQAGSTLETGQVAITEANLSDVNLNTPAVCSTNGAYSIGQGPEVTGVSPGGGLTAGGTKVTITGGGFTGATAVHFGSAGATSFTVVNDSDITATAPAGTGLVDVTVTTPMGTTLTGPDDLFGYAGSSGQALVIGAFPAKVPSGEATGLTAVLLAPSGVPEPSQNISFTASGSLATLSPPTLWTGANGQVTTYLVDPDPQTVTVTASATTSYGTVTGSTEVTFVTPSMGTTGLSVSFSGPSLTVPVAATSNTEVTGTLGQGSPYVLDVTTPYNLAPPLAPLITAHALSSSVVQTLVSQAPDVVLSSVTPFVVTDAGVISAFQVATSGTAATLYGSGTTTNPDLEVTLPYFTFVAGQVPRVVWMDASQDIWTDAGVSIVSVGSTSITALVPNLGDFAVAMVTIGPPPTSPPPATTIAATPGDGEVTLTWSPAATATSYDVFESTTSGSYGATPVATSTTTGTTISGLTDNATYYFTVKAVNGLGSGPASNEVSATPVAAISPPVAPVGLAATAADGSVMLTWGAVAGATSYEVFESTTSGSYGTTPTVTTTSTSATISGLTDNATYYFTVKAVNAAGAGPASIEASAMPMGPPPAPMGLSATAGSGQATLTWGAVVGATSYEIFESTTSGAYGTTPTMTTTSTSATMSGLAGGRTYYFTVKAVDAAGEGAPSAEAVVRLGAAPPPPTTDTTATGIISATGGTLSTSDNSMVMHVPSGAFNQSVNVTVTELATTVAPPPPAGETTAAVWSFDTGGAEPSQPVTLTFAYDPATLGSLSPDRLGVYLYDPTTDSWSWVGGTVDAATDTISVTVSHLSTYAALANTQTFTDLGSYVWAEPSIDTLLGASMVQGVSQETFDPAGSVTRAEFTKLLVEALSLGTSSATATAFTDVSAQAWYAPYVAAAVKAGLVRGLTSSTFAPDAVITRQEMAAMLYRAMAMAGVTSTAGTSTFTDGQKISSWARAAVFGVSGAGLMNGFADGTFQPDGTATRAQSAVVVDRLLHLMGRV